MRNGLGKGFRDRFGKGFRDRLGKKFGNRMGWVSRTMSMLMSMSMLMPMLTALVVLLTIACFPPHHVSAEQAAKDSVVHQRQDPSPAALQQAQDPSPAAQRQVQDPAAQQQAQDPSAQRQVQDPAAQQRTQNSAGAIRQEQLFSALLSGNRIMGEHDYVPAKQLTVYLTFDDGPSGLTSQVLDILKSEGVRATFFALGELAEDHPKMVKRIVNEGHSLGNHSYNHEYSELYTGFEAFWKQIQRTEEVFNKLAGVRPKLVRAPGGTYRHFDAFYFYYLDRAGYSVYDWHIDSGDSKRRNVPAKEIVDNVKKGKLTNELVVLLHDGAGHGETVKALPDIIAYFKKKGYTFAPLSQKVKPVMFSLGKIGKKRDYSESKLERLAELVDSKVMSEQRELEQYDTGQEQRLAFQGQDAVAESANALQQLAYQGQVAITESAEALKQLDNERQVSVTESTYAPEQPHSDDLPSLSLRIGSEQWRLDSQRYDLRDGSFHVPLRQLIEQMGGQVVWDNEKKIATVRCGFQIIQYQYANRVLRAFQPGKEDKVTHLAAMDMKNGSIKVPLRATLELLNNKVSEFTVNRQKREVIVDHRTDSCLAYTVLEADPKSNRSKPSVASTNPLNTKAENIIRRQV